jgi:hypothetical protein
MTWASAVWCVQALKEKYHQCAIKAVGVRCENETDAEDIKSNTVTACVCALVQRRE